MHGLDGRIMLERVLAQVLAEAGLFETAERDLELRHRSLVNLCVFKPYQLLRVVDTDTTTVTYVDAARLERMPNPERALDVLREEIGRETVHGVVRELDDFLLVFELDDDRDRPKDLLLRDLHARLHVGKNSRLDEVPVFAELLSPNMDIRAFLLARFNITHYSLQRDVSGDMEITASAD